MTVENRIDEDRSLLACEHRRISGCRFCKTWKGRPALESALGSLRGRRLKGKGQGVLGARETRGAREEGGKEKMRNTMVSLQVFPSLSPRAPLAFL